MSKAGLPPGPWKVVTDSYFADGDRFVVGFNDAEGRPVLVQEHGEEITVSPGVVAAIEALPVLVDRVRNFLADLNAAKRDIFDSLEDGVPALEEVMARIDAATTS